MRPLEGTVTVEISSGWSAAAVASSVLTDLGTSCHRIAEDIAGRVEGALLDPEMADGVRRWAAALDGLLSRDKLSANTAQLESLLLRTDFLVVDEAGYELVRRQIGWTGLRAQRPRLIVGALTNLGLTGPLSECPGTELTAQAASGVLATTGHPHTGPVRVGFPLGQQATALNAATAMLALWRCRDHQEKMPLVDAAVFDTFVGYLSTFLDNFVAGEVDRGLLGNHHPLLCPWNTYATADGMMVICVPTDAHWRRMFDLISGVASAEDSSLQRDWLTPQRLQHREAIDRWVEAWTLRWHTADAIQRLADSGVPCAAVLDLADALTDDALRERQPLHGVAQGAHAGLPFRMSPL